MNSFNAHMVAQPDAGYRVPIKAVAPPHAFDSTRQVRLGDSPRRAVAPLLNLGPRFPGRVSGYVSQCTGGAGL
jgi:hypothetical protein